MSIETTLFCSINLCDKCYSNRHQIDADIDETQQQFDWVKKKLYALACMTEPNKFCDSEDTPQNYIDQEFRNALELYNELHIELYQLELLLENWDNAVIEKQEPDGRKVYAKRWPDGLHWNSAFVCSDFLPEENDTNNTVEK